MERRVSLFLLALAFLAAASAASAFLSIAASRQPTPTPTAGPTPTPEPLQGGQKNLQQQQPLPTTTAEEKSRSLGSSSSCRAAKKASPLVPPLFASAPAWQRGMRRRMKVLAVPLVSGRSHLFVMHAVAAELAARGHEVKVKKSFFFFVFFLNRSRDRRDTFLFSLSCFLCLPASSLSLFAC